MSAITPEILSRIKAYRLPGLELDGDFIHPDYLGGSILNLPSSICQWLDVEPLGVAPLRHELTATVSNGIRRVVLVLVDALALHRLRSLLRRRLLHVGRGRHRVSRGLRDVTGAR